MTWLLLILILAAAMGGLDWAAVAIAALFTLAAIASFWLV
jgi:hypothetical protein